MSRIIFTTLGALLNLVQLAFPFWAWANGIKIGNQPFGGADFVGYYLLLAVYLVAIGIIYVFRDAVPLSWWMISPSKRIYHAELGALYAELSTKDEQYNTKEMTIWKQYWLISKQITQVDYTENKELLIQRTKNALDKLVKEGKEEKKKKKSETPAFDEWDGYIDKQSKRDDKLNGIGI